MKLDPLSYYEGHISAISTFVFELQNLINDLRDTQEKFIEERKKHE